MSLSNPATIKDNDEDVQDPDKAALANLGTMHHATIVPAERPNWGGAASTSIVVSPPPPSKQVALQASLLPKKHALEEPESFELLRNVPEHVQMQGPCLLFVPSRCAVPASLSAEAVGDGMSVSPIAKENVRRATTLLLADRTGCKRAWGTTLSSR